MLFSGAMEFHLPNVPSTAEGRDALTDAAVGLSKELSGDRQSGRSVYQDIAEGGYGDKVDSLARLLGLALLAWSAPDNAIDVIREARTQVLELEDSTLRCLYLAKLGTFSYDLGDQQLARDLFGAARDAAPSSRRLLRWRLATVASRLEGLMLLSEPPRTRDDLVDFPWIGALANEASHKAIVSAAQEAAANPWARGFHFGLTPSDRATAAATQAEWAGALWMLPRLRLQAAAQILLVGGRSAEEWVLATGMWILGGGQQLPSILEYAEPHFTSESLYQLVHDHLRDGARVDNRRRYVETIRQYWDLLSAPEAAAVLDWLDLDPPSPEDASDNRALSAVIGAMVPREWTDWFLQLSVDHQTSVLSYASAGLVMRLPARARARMTQRWLGRVESTSTDPQEADAFWEVGAALALQERRTSTLTRFLRALRVAPPLQRLKIAALLPQFRGQLDVDDALEEVMRGVQAAADAAREGQMSFGGLSPTDRLAIGLLDHPDREQVRRIVHQLVEIALDPTVTNDYRAEVMLAIVRIAFKHRPYIPADRFRDIEVHPEHAGWSSSPPDFLRAISQLVAAVAQPGPGDSTLLLSFTRDPDPRIRELSLDAIAELVAEGQDPVLEMALLGALYDPSRTVLSAGLRALARLGPSVETILEVVVERLAKLYKSEGRTVRAHTARVARALLAAGSQDDRLRNLLTTAERDRSWRVREAATG